MLPNFLVIGAAKCGTTSICDLLGKHPDVFMSNPKEPCYFSHEGLEHRTRAWYESLFDAVSTESAIGEGSTAYTHPDVINEVASKIRATIPNCRLIYMVRHPVKRLESDWRMRRHEKWTPGSISDAVVQQRSLVSHGLYWRNLNVYRQLFDDRQILVIFFEDLVSEPDATLERCFAHLAVDTNFQASDAGRPRNSSANFRADGFVARFLRQQKSFDQIKQILPTWLTQAAKSLLTTREEFRISWQPDVLAKVTAEFIPDAAQLLAYCGKPPDFWNFTPDEETVD